MLPVRLDIRKATAIKDGDEVVGNLVRVKVVKNKVAPPFRKAEFDIMFGEGISRAGEVFGLAVANNIIERAAAGIAMAVLNSDRVPMPARHCSRITLNFSTNWRLRFAKHLLLRNRNKVG